jgi:hypothetical protein
MLHDGNPHHIFPAVNPAVAEPRPVPYMLTDNVVVVISGLAQGTYAGLQFFQRPCGSFCGM